jgi:hypothetical protein
MQYFVDPISCFYKSCKHMTSIFGENYDWRFSISVEVFSRTSSFVEKIELV